MSKATLNKSTAPESIDCPLCGQKSHYSIKGRSKNQVYGSYRCQPCNRIWTRQWFILQPEPPDRATCPECGDSEIPLHGIDEKNRRATYYHEVHTHAGKTFAHRWDLEYTDDGWMTYKPRGEAVRVYETRVDCCTSPGAPGHRLHRTGFEAISWSAYIPNSITATNRQ